jgi:hypothetical protein
MIITKPGKYILTSDYEQWAEEWAIRVHPAGSIINVTAVGNNIDGTGDGNFVVSNELGSTSDDLPVFPYPQVVQDNSDIVWGPPGSKHTKLGE